MRRSIFIFLQLLPILISAQPGKMWDVRYEKDKLKSSARLDLRYLNESYAGEHGFIKLSPDSNSFVSDNDEPIRFWGTNISPGLLNQPIDKMDSIGRSFAKVGFNMVRYHASINPKGDNSNLLEPDRNEIDRIWKLVASMKKSGIYTTISPFWAHNGHMGGNIPKDWGIEGYSGKDDLFGLLFFNEKLQTAYKSWVKRLYTEINPYTGIALKDEPAVGIIQIQNEDGVFFWTFSSLKPEQKKILRSKFATWLINKHGSIELALKKWDFEKIDGDDFANNQPELYPIYEMTLNQSGSKTLRLNDQVQFYAEIQRSFYDEIHDFYRNELGCKQLINGCNWKTADVLRLNDLERWTNSGCEVIAVNRYVGGGHFGLTSGWKVSPGDTYFSKSALKSPEILPTNLKQVQGHPMIITESGWNLPNRYQVEGPFLSAAYQSLTGVDALYWFTMDNGGLSDYPYFSHLDKTDSTHSLMKWNLSIPACWSMMPANALTYRLGYIRQSKTVIHEERSLESLFRREIPLISENSTFDPNRDSNFTMNNQTNGVGLSQLIYLTGGVEVNYTTKPTSNRINPNLDSLIDIKDKKVNSETGELEFDYGKGISVVNTPYTQSVCGFLNFQKEFNLQNVRIFSNNEYGSVQVVSMDKLPIKSSKKILIQTGTIYLPTNWKENKSEIHLKNQTIDGYKITQTGRMPWQGQNVEATVEISNPSLSKATLLTTSGYISKKLTVSRGKGILKIKLPENSMYIIVE